MSPAAASEEIPEARTTYRQSSSAELVTESQRQKDAPRPASGRQPQNRSVLSPLGNDDPYSSGASGSPIGGIVEA